MQLAVDVAHLKVSLGGREVLHGVDLRVPAGEAVAILGTNGSGKSTLVKAVVGLLRPDAGSVSLFGTPRHQFRDHARIGYVPQRVTAVTGVPATVREMVTEGRLARRSWFRPLDTDGRTAVDASIELMGLAGLANRSVSELSGGQQQRVLIARALAGEPDLLVLDEPTAGVDLASQEVLALAATELLHQGRTLLLVSHDLGPLAPLLSHMLVLRDGNVAYSGEPDAEHSEPHVHLHHGADHHSGQGWLP